MLSINLHYYMFLFKLLLTLLLIFNIHFINQPTNLLRLLFFSSFLGGGTSKKCVLESSLPPVVNSSKRNMARLSLYERPISIVHNSCCICLRKKRNIRSVCNTSYQTIYEANIYMNRVVQKLKNVQAPIFLIKSLIKNHMNSIQ